MEVVKLPRLKKKKKRHILLKLFFILVILIFIAIFFFCYYIVDNAPEFDVNNLYVQESTVLLYNDKTEFARLGIENREIVTYEKLPQVLIDAIVATEDARFFQHDGFDLGRFIKASFGQLEGDTSAGGASTITMQISKNAFTSTEAKGIEGIIRKFTDIYLATFKIERKYSKEEILEFYVNYPYLGGSSYGVQQASRTYFGKDVQDLNLVEAATIAGLFKAPYSYSPYIDLEASEQRKNQVLELMYRHKYITEDQLTDAKRITVDSLLDKTEKTDNEYQDFIDTVVEQVSEETGQDPYTTPMIIYTTMDPYVQKSINKVMQNKSNFKDAKGVQAGIAVTSSKNGAILGIGAGRNRTGARQYNYATMIKRHPGSSIKPFMDYGPLFEYNGATPETIIKDEPYTYSDGTAIFDADRQYRGAMTIREALAQSRNIPALKAFQQVDKKKIANYVHSFGIDYGDTLYESASIGGFDGVSPLVMSAAYGAYARGGYYIAPYSYTKIIYRDSGEEYVKNIKKVKVCSEQTAKWINEILVHCLEERSLGILPHANTEIAGKTGTSTVSGKKIRQLGIDVSAIMDSWACVYSREYSYALWYGYDKITRKHYMVPYQGSNGRKRISRKISKYLFQTNSKLLTS